MEKESVKVIMEHFPTVKNESPQKKGIQGQPTERNGNLNTWAQLSDVHTHTKDEIFLRS